MSESTNSQEEFLKLISLLRENPNDPLLLSSLSTILQRHGYVQNHPSYQNLIDQIKALGVSNNLLTYNLKKETDRVSLLKTTMLEIITILSDESTFKSHPASLRMKLINLKLTLNSKY